LIIVKVDRARSISQKKAQKQFFLKILQNYWKIMDTRSHSIFETDLEKNQKKKTNFFSKIKKEKKKRKEKLLQSYNPCLDSQSVKSWEKSYILGY